MAITIQNASERDLDELYEVEIQCFKEEAFTKRQIAGLLSDLDSLCLIARDGDDVIGFSIGRVHVERALLTGHVLTIDVLPMNRRKGIGTMLLKRMERILRQKGVRICRLEVRENNVAALGLYEKLGYEKLGRLKNYYENAHGILMSKRLT